MRSGFAGPAVACRPGMTARSFTLFFGLLATGSVIAACSATNEGDDAKASGAEEQPPTETTTRRVPSARVMRRRNATRVPRRGAANDPPTYSVASDAATNARLEATPPPPSKVPASAQDAVSVAATGELK